MKCIRYQQKITDSRYLIEKLWSLKNIAMTRTIHNIEINGKQTLVIHSVEVYPHVNAGAICGAWFST